MLTILIITFVLLISIGYFKCFKNIVEENIEYKKPNAKSFVFLRFITRSIVLVVFAIVALFFVKFLFGVNISLNYLFIFLTLLVIYNYISLSVQYKKEKYFFFKDKLIHQGGGIFTDFKNELNIKNITHVNMTLPFIENKLFKTGHVRIESAGTSASEIFLKSVNTPKSFYEKIMQIMRENGFKLTLKNKLQEAKPHVLAVIFEIIGIVFATIFFGTIMILDFFSENKINIKEFMAKYSDIIFPCLIVISVLGLFFLVFRFLDLKKRLYQLYDDTIVYREGFLSKHYSFMPVENLTDSSIKQSFISRIFGLYDVKISCQGSKQEILFKNMKNGELLSNNIDKIINENKGVLIKPTKDTLEPKEEITTPIKHVAHKIHVDRTYMAEFKMNTFRTWMHTILFSPLLIVVFPLLIIDIVRNIISVSANKFTIKANTIKHEFTFLHKKAKEFSFDKITGIIFKENFIDKWCNTCSILFWSVGSGENIKFRNIKKTENLREKILAKKGIVTKNPVYETHSSYSIASMIAGNLYKFLIIVGLVILGFVLFGTHMTMPLMFLLIATILVYIYKVIYYKRSKILFYEDYLYFTRGIFFVDHYFVRYDDLKDVETKKFPLSNKGNIKLNVSGETIVKTQNSTKITSHSFTMYFAKDVPYLNSIIGTIMYRGYIQDIEKVKESSKQIASEIKYSVRPHLANCLAYHVLAILLLLTIGVFGFHWVSTQEPDILSHTELLLSLFAIAVSIWFIITVIIIKVISYKIHSYVVCKYYGVIYRKCLSIPFNKIDFINSNQNAVNKVFKTGNVTINTIGSSVSELTVANISSFNKFYEVIKSNYKKHNS